MRSLTCFLMRRRVLVIVKLRRRMLMSMMMMRKILMQIMGWRYCAARKKGAEESVIEGSLPSCLISFYIPPP